MKGGDGAIEYRGELESTRTKWVVGVGVAWRLENGAMEFS